MKDKQDLKEKSFLKFININKHNQPQPKKQENNSIEKQYYKHNQIANSNSKTTIARANSPMLNTMSIALSEKRNAHRSNQKAWEGLYNFSKQQDIHHFDLLASKIEKDNIKHKNECPFAPQIKSNFHVELEGDIPTRTAYWKQRKLEKIETRKKELELKEIHECYFEPRILPQSKSKMETLTPRSIKGVENYYKRIQNADEATKQKYSIMNKFDGRTWKHQTTVPIEFNLSFDQQISKHSPQKKKLTMVSDFLIDSAGPLQATKQALHNKLHMIDLDNATINK